MGLRVLLATRSDERRQWLADELRHSFSDATIVETSGPESIEQFLIEDEFDLVMADEWLRQPPSLSWVEAVQLYNPNCPAVLVSFGASPQGTVSALKAGAIVCDATHGPEAVIHAARQALKRSAALEVTGRRNARLRRLLNRLGIGVFCAATDGRILEMNPAMLRLIGCEDPETSRPTTLRELFSNPNNCDELLCRLTTESPIHGLEAELRRCDGTSVWIELTAALATTRDGQVTLDGLVRNITERKRHEEALRVAEGQLRQAQKMEALGRLVGGIAHDFNNVLTGILGYTDLLLTQPLDAAARSDLEQVEKLATRAADLVRRLLIFSRKEPLRLVPTSINTLIRNTVAMLERAMGEDLRVTLDLCDAPTDVHCDPIQIEHVLLNIAANARDAMPHGGVFRIETQVVELAADAKTAALNLLPGRHVFIRATDTGCGMDGSVRQRIFEPFFTTKEVGKGTGLGLATAYGIVRQHGGSITVDSAPGQGTTFSILLPELTANEHDPAMPPNGDVAADPS